VPLDEKGFTGYVAERLRKVAPNLTFEIAESLGLDAVTADGKVVGRLGLERVWQFCTIAARARSRSTSRAWPRC